jgi:uncharacterized protein (DUF305 family)
MHDHSTPIQSFSFVTGLKLPFVISSYRHEAGLTAAAALVCFLSLPVRAQQADSKAPPVVVQPGAPGQPTRTLPPRRERNSRPVRTKDVEFIQEMIMHHAQAVEMAALIESRTQNREIRLLGARISHSQAEEMNFMKRWLAARGESATMPMSKTSGDHAHQSMNMSSTNTSSHRCSCPEC